MVRETNKLNGMNGFLATYRSTNGKATSRTDPITNMEMIDGDLQL